jgi:hypothetical protein
MIDWHYACYERQNEVKTIEPGSYQPSDATDLQ